MSSSSAANRLNLRLWVSDFRQLNRFRHAALRTRANLIEEEAKQEKILRAYLSFESVAMVPKFPLPRRHNKNRGH